MGSIDATAGRAQPDTKGVNKLYFAAWRWHFYAGLYVAPFLMMLAVTGLVMLWVSATTELNGERTAVAVAGDPVAVSVQADAVLAAFPGATLTQYIEPRGPGRVALFRANVADVDTAILVNPYTAEIVDSFATDDSWYTLANQIHGDLLLGTFGDRMIEIAASFGIVLVVTGLYLWWPRGGVNWAAVLIPNFAARGRTLWKSLHQSIGFWVAALLLLFLVSGLSWAGIWGDRFVQAWNTFPAEKWDAPLSDDIHASMNHGAENEVPWPLELAPMPMSGSLKGMAAIAGPVTIDSAVAFARSLGFDGRFQLTIPGDATGVWTISHDTMSHDGGNAMGDRTLHIDQYTGRVLVDVGFADYALYAKMMAVGIAFHEGNFGNWNLALNTVFCLSIIFLSVSGLVMWWKRRPAGALRLAAPPMPQDMPLWKGAVLITLFLSLAFPMVGLTLLAVLLFDLVLVSRIPLLRRFMT